MPTGGVAGVHITCVPVAGMAGVHITCVPVAGVAMAAVSAVRKPTDRHDAKSHCAGRKRDDRRVHDWKATLRAKRA